MKIVCFANNRVGWKIVEWLRGRSEEIVALVVHPESRARYGAEIRRAANLPEDRIFDGSALSDPKVIDRIRALAPEIGVSAYFGYLFKPEFIALFPRGIVNVHPALLPYNRGAHPNIWSILEKSPAGATLHYVDAGIDTGPIIAQRPVVVEPIDTGESLYRKLEESSFELFRENWPPRVAMAAAAKPAVGSFHQTRDLAKTDRIDLDRSYRAGELLDLIRARTFPGYPGAYFEAEGKRVYVRLQLEYADGPRTEP